MRRKAATERYTSYTVPVASEEWVMRISMSRFGILFAATAAAALAGCATDQGMGVREGVAVTRFHLNQPIARGVIAIEAATIHFVRRCMVESIIARTAVH